MERMQKCKNLCDWDKNYNSGVFVDPNYKSSLEISKSNTADQNEKNYFIQMEMGTREFLNAD